MKHVPNNQAFRETIAFKWFRLEDVGQELAVLVIEDDLGYVGSKRIHRKQLKYKERRVMESDLIIKLNKR